MKTRLIPALGPEAAAELSLAMAEDALERFGPVRSGGAGGGRRSRSGAETGAETKAPLEREIRYSGSAPAAPGAPRKTREPGLTLPPGWTARPQGEGDLGDRLRRAADAARAGGVEALAFIGGDAPLLPRELVTAGFESVVGEAAADAAVAPAEDGGFVLLALSLFRVDARRARALLADVPWGTAGVLERLRENAAAARIRLAGLPRFWDVDRPQDLARLRRELEAAPDADRPRRTAALLARLRETTRAAAAPRPREERPPPGGGRATRRSAGDAPGLARAACPGAPSPR